MMRKKNITLNGKKANGNEKLLSGDHVKLFLSDETFEKFSGTDKAPRAYHKLDIIYEDENFTSYIEGDRAYIKFTMKCKRQLIYALKKKGWWWNSYKLAWSTYLDRVNTEWIKNISEKYEEYL